MTDKQEMDIKSIGAELAKILIDMTDEEKAVAFAMMKGMVVGKQIAEQQKSAQEVIYKANTHTDEIFNVYGALDNLNKRMKIVEEKVPNYTADMLEVYRNLGALTKRIAELENLINKKTTTLKRGEEDE